MQDLTNHIELSDEEKKLYSEWKAYVSLYINGCSYHTLNQLDHISHSISK